MSWGLGKFMSSRTSANMISRSGSRDVQAGSTRSLNMGKTLSGCMRASWKDRSCSMLCALAWLLSAAAQTV